jgi:hypothetical protein
MGPLAKGISEAEAGRYVGRVQQDRRCEMALARFQIRLSSLSKTHVSWRILAAPSRAFEAQGCLEGAAPQVTGTRCSLGSLGSLAVQCGCG